MIAPPGRFRRHHHQNGSTSKSTSAHGLWKSIVWKAGKAKGTFLEGIEESEDSGANRFGV